MKSPYRLPTSTCGFTLSRHYSLFLKYVDNFLGTHNMDADNRDLCYIYRERIYIRDGLDS